MVQDLRGANQQGFSSIQLSRQANTWYSDYASAQEWAKIMHNARVPSVSQFRGSYGKWPSDMAKWSIKQSLAPTNLAQSCPNLVYTYSSTWVWIWNHELRSHLHG